MTGSARYLNSGAVAPTAFKSVGNSLTSSTCLPLHLARPPSAAKSPALPYLPQAGPAAPLYATWSDTPYDGRRTSPKRTSAPAQIDFQPALAGSKTNIQSVSSASTGRSYMQCHKNIKVQWTGAHGNISVKANAKASGRNSSRSDQTKKYSS